MNTTVKTVLMAAGIFTVVVAANLATQAFYARASVKKDVLTGLLAITGGVIITSILITKIK